MKKNWKIELENRNEAIFQEKNRNEQQPDNLSGIENKDKIKARLSLGLSRIVVVKGTLYDIVY